KGGAHVASRRLADTGERARAEARATDGGLCPPFDSRRPLRSMRFTRRHGRFSPLCLGTLRPHTLEMIKLIISDNEGTTTVVPLVRDEISIGRKEGNTIRLTERNISREHCRLARKNGSYVVRD